MKYPKYIFILLTLHNNMEPITQKILEKIKQNKKYSTISDKLILTEIKNYLKQNPSTNSDKQTIKEIRARLHRLYSSYQTKSKKKVDTYLNQLKEAKTKKQILEITNKLLQSTLSTKERLQSYSEIYKKIFKITGKPKTIIDLASGLNIFSYPLTNLLSLTYYSYDINEEDLRYINTYIHIMNNHSLKFKLKGKASIQDLRGENKIKKQSDIILMFKIIDLLSTKQTENLILTNITKTNHIIASFATKTLTRKQMNKPKRKWFELMLQRNNLKFQTFNTDNELFYIINK